MVNEEVENILSEIRERVRARELPGASRAIPATDSEAAEPFIVSPDMASNSAAAHIVESYLTTTARAWDRLPPIASNRSGAIAKCELWLKRQIKRMTHWFTWEQVNYNAAVHHALLNTLEAIAHNEQSAAKRMLEIQRAIAGQAGVMQEVRVQLEALGQALRQEMGHELIEHNARIEEQRASQFAAQEKDLNARLLALTQELNVRFEQLIEEQRVCFKQLSLEATEEAVLEDRARRKRDKLIDELSRRIQELEK